ncbi:oligosaccharide flippase family protein [Gordonia sp. NB41Y]|uniref:lipopolysaccharide biosynthesis protein n=1 Tax=Gordonia sp. NB41Y TaxID=875808 RepID=UPI0006B199F3|nr:oligosaccharide flippase family protein [Gordonia sp. NB41Y]EMP10136.2 polysaccharide biosynthesis protein [Gordonia sp. NB41Y]WLP90943.1 oligosaccharide flippase family protein [Gordonia sp. NB41Y]
MSVRERSSLARSSLALAVSGLLTAAMGLVYWVLAGRLYPAREVGAAAAVITTATMLSAFGNLGIGAYLERFLPLAGDRARWLPGIGLAVGAGCGALLGVGFLLVGPTGEMFDGMGEMALFPLIVVVLSMFALLDHLSIAMERAHWAAGKNVVHAVAKLAAVVVFAVGADRMGLVGSWILLAAITGGVVWWWAARELAERARSVPAGHLLPSKGVQGRFLLGNYGVYVAGAITPLILPPIVIGRVGAAQNAYFSIVWSLVSAVLVLLTMLIGPYVAATSTDSATADTSDGSSLRHTRTFVATLIGGASAAALCLAFLGPIILRIAGPDYAEFGTPLLRVGALALPPAAVALCFVGVCRVRCNLAPALAVQIVSATIMLTLTTLWIGEYGLVSAGWAMVIAESTAAVLVAVPLARAVLGLAPLAPAA